MTPDAKRQLSATIRELRTRLLEDLHAATETAYRLSVRTRDAGLDAAATVRRGRLEAWMAEQVRARLGTGRACTAEDFRREAEKRAAYTLLNRLVILRLMEASGLRSPAVVTGGWDSMGYMDLRQIASALVRGDETEGYAFLLRLVFEDLALELPGLYGSADEADLVPVPAATLRHVVEALDDPALESCWTDDMTLGWTYQYWNDPEREAIDAKLNSGGKVEPHEIASKTQMFTERYMVDWLLQNSLGPMWLAMCRKHGWTPEVVADGTLERLEERRIEWRARRDARQAALAEARARQAADPTFEIAEDKLPGVSLTELMPLHTDAERRWAYYVPQPIPDDAVAQAPETVRDLKLLDIAVGSGHFEVVAFDLLVALYREEARHRGEQGDLKWSDKAIVERILEHNLYGIDLDPRAVQIAAAALWLKARQTCPDARPRQLNLVASNLRLSSLPDDDPALLELRREVERETGIPAALTDTILHALRGADHLGTLLKVDRAVEAAIAAHEQAIAVRLRPTQPDFFLATPPRQPEVDFEAAAARRSLLERLEGFLERHTSGNDLGLRLRGEQFAAGVRFVRMVREGQYDLVVGNPPYQGTSKMTDAAYVQSHYPLGKADLYAAFLLRGLELARDGGVSAMLTMRNWMFIKQYAGLREHLLEDFDLGALHDLSSGAFEEISAAQVVVTVVTSVFRKAPRSGQSVALKAFDDATVTQVCETQRKRAASLCHVGRHEFDLAALKVVPEWPLVYWWGKEFLDAYDRTPKIGDTCPPKYGANTGDNTRFVRSVWESRFARCHTESGWAPFIKGAAGLAWFEPIINVINWVDEGTELHQRVISRFGEEGVQWKVCGRNYYFRIGIAFTSIGSSFAARIHRTPSVMGNAGSSLFPDSPAEVLCLLNSRRCKSIVEALNPTVNFMPNDIRRLPLFPITSANEIFTQIETAFTTHESHREPSVEFRCPGPSPWRHAQAWAQVAVDRPEGAPLPLYVEELDPEPPTDRVSFALGVALGRFGVGGEGILDPAKDDVSRALPAGILFLDGSLEANDHRDSLGHAATRVLHDTWTRHGAAIDAGCDLRTWLRLRFFGVHRGIYENRPIHWPLSSERRTFVAWVTIHRWAEQTLRLLLADHLVPALTRIDGELSDLRAARDGADRRAAREAEKRYATVLKVHDELAAFIVAVGQCADKGPPPTDPDPKKCAPRETDSRYAPDLDDGVMINSAALWPLLEPQWKDPRKWWIELALAKGKKDYDWSHLARRYWPTRVDAKCQEDPSFGVAHGCFWKYHPARAWAWELRLQAEIGPDFRIQETPYRGDGGDPVHRAAYIRDHAQNALEAVEKEALRRRGRGEKTHAVPELRLLESGLWSTLPEACWALELRVSERQGEEFRLLAPDEPSSRTVYEAAHPAEVKARAEFIAHLVPQPVLFVDGEEPDDAGNAEAADDDSGEEDGE